MIPPEDQGFGWVLTLYVNGISLHSVAALETIRRICDEELTGQVVLKVIDVHDHPQDVAADQVVAVPTLIRRLPQPLRQLVGDLADSERVRVGLELRPPPAAHGDTTRDRPAH